MESGLVDSESSLGTRVVTLSLIAVGMASRIAWSPSSVDRLRAASFASRLSIRRGWSCIIYKAESIEEPSITDIYTVYTRGSSPSRTCLGTLLMM